MLEKRAKMKAAAVNPVGVLNLTGAVRLIQDYKMLLTLGNECAGIVEKVGKAVTGFQIGDRVDCISGNYRRTLLGCSIRC